MPALNPISADRKHTLAEALGVAFAPSAESRHCEVVAFTGSGGKTTAMLRLAGELIARGARVLITTTTHIYPPDSRQFPATVIEDSLDALVRSARSALDRHPAVVLARGLSEDGKLVGIDPEWLDQLSKQLQVTHILVEADGSRGRPFKAPAAHEPVIPGSADLVVAVVGLSVIGRPLSEEFVHRPERVAELAGCRLGDTVSPPVVAAVLLHSRGSTRGAPAGSRVVLLLNQADDEARAQAGCEVARELIERGAEHIVIAGLREPVQIRKVHVKAVSAVVLAAGEGRRMSAEQAKGRSKLALRLGEKSILRRVVEAVLASSVNEVVVVLGHGAAELEQELPRDPRLRSVFNPDYATGQSSSLKAGIKAITSSQNVQPETPAQAAVFLLGDQPLISPQAIDAVVRAFRSRQSALVRPSYRGTPGHPVLFSRALFQELLQVTGDQGGRELLARHEGEIETVELNLDSPIDIDTQKDYSQLIRNFPDLEKL
jgi:molybdenum cofactor cytidylyltransferase